VRIITDAAKMPCVIEARNARSRRIKREGPIHRIERENLSEPSFNLMKSPFTRISVATFITLLGLGALLSGTAQGQLYVADWHTGGRDGTIGLYTAAGAAVNSRMVTGLAQPNALATDGKGNLYVACGDNTVSSYTMSGTRNTSFGTSGWPYGVAVDGLGNVYVSHWTSGAVGKYTAAGALVNASFITGLNGPTGLALDGKGNLYVANEGSGTIGVYSTSGATINASLISGLVQPVSLALDGQGRLYVSNYGDSFLDGSIGVYSTSGATINASLIAGLPRSVGIALNGSGLLYESNAGDGSVRVYTTSGALVNPSLIAGLIDPAALLYVPEPSFVTLFTLAAVLAGIRRRAARR
jgi:hypothetical protein